MAVSRPRLSLVSVLHAVVLAAAATGKEAYELFQSHATAWYGLIILIGLTGFVTDQILALFHGVLFPWAGNPGRFSRAVASFLAWPMRAVASLTKRLSRETP
jgi:hypothetical protein